MYDAIIVGGGHNGLVTAGYLSRAGWNVLVGTDAAAITRAMRDFRPHGARPDLFGDGHAAERVVDALSTARVSNS